MNEKELIEKWLNNSLSETEKQEFQNSENYPFYSQLIKDASHFKASLFSQANDYESLRQRLPQKEVPVRKLNHTTWFLRIASIFVLGFALYYFFLNQPMVHVETQAGQKTSVELPDASLVVLNASSEIKYNTKEWKQKRSLELKGEAFFDVAKGSKFDVITSLGTVSVLGTEFNVRQRETSFEVVCYEGVVRVVSGNIARELRAGDRVRLLNGEMITSKTDFEGPQWTNNISDFQAVPFIEVIEEMERQYNIKIIAQDIATDTLFSGGFVHNDLENALRSITEPLGLEFKLEENNVVTLRSREN